MSVKMKVVEFVKTYPPYMIHETAGFKEPVADKLVRLGYAKYREDIKPKYGVKRKNVSNGEIDIQHRNEEQKEKRNVRRQRKASSDEQTEAQ